MRYQEVPTYPQNESYDKFCILLIFLLKRKCFETNPYRNKDSTNKLLSDNEIDYNIMERFHSDIIKEKFWWDNKKMIHAILIETCLEDFYKANFLQDIKFNPWRYNSWCLEESYWLYIRMLDSLVEWSSAISFGKGIVEFLWFKKCSEIYNNILKDNNESKYKWYLWGKVLNKNGDIYLRSFEKKDLENIKTAIIPLKKEERLIFSIFYTTYNLRNKYAHINFPIPSKLFRSNGLILPATIDEAIGIWKKEWNDTSFIYFLDYIKRYNEYATESNGKRILINAKSFRLLPSIEFIKEISKLILIEKINEYYPHSSLLPQ